MQWLLENPSRSGISLFYEQATRSVRVGTIIGIPAWHIGRENNRCEDSVLYWHQKRSKKYASANENASRPEI